MAKKLVIVSVPKFGEMEGHILIISKTLYGLWISGLCWHDCFSWVSPQDGFILTKANPDICMQHDDNYYKYIVVHVDNLVIASKDLKGIVDVLTNTYRFKHKGMGAIDYHLGMSFTRNKYGYSYVSLPRGTLRRWLTHTSRCSMKSTVQSHLLLTAMAILKLI
jgi:hypothetical protein